MKQSQLWSQYHDKNELKHELREVGSFAMKFYIHMISITHPTFDNGNSRYPTACSGKGVQFIPSTNRQVFCIWYGKEYPVFLAECWLSHYIVLNVEDQLIGL